MVHSEKAKSAAKIGGHFHVSRGQSFSMKTSAIQARTERQNSSMKIIGIISILAFILLSMPVFSQAARYDSNVQTVSSACVVGSQCPVLAVPGSTVSVCINSACNIFATTYTDSTASTPCPINAQLTPSSGGACSSAGDNQGGFGLWITPGTYWYTITYPLALGGGTYPASGGYAFTVGGGGGTGGSGTLSGGWNGTAYVDEVITNPVGRTYFVAPYAVGPLPNYCITPSPGPCPGQPALPSAQGPVVSIIGNDPAVPLCIPNVTGPCVNLPILVGRSDAVTLYTAAYDTVNYPRVWSNNCVIFKTIVSAGIGTYGGYDSCLEASVSNFVSEYGLAQGPDGAGSIVGVRSNYVGGANLGSAAFSTQHACGTAHNCGWASGIWLDGLADRSSLVYNQQGAIGIRFADDGSAGGGMGTGIDCTQVHGGFVYGCLFLPSVDIRSGIQSTALTMLNPQGYPYPFLFMDASNNWLIAGASGGLGQTELLAAEGGLVIGGGSYPRAGAWGASFSSITATMPGNPTVLTIPSHGFSNGQNIFISGYTGLWAVGTRDSLGRLVQPGVNGAWAVTVIDANTISIPANTSTGFGAPTGTPVYLVSGTAQFGSGVGNNTDLDGVVAFSAQATANFTLTGSYFKNPVCTLTAGFNPGGAGAPWVTYSLPTVTINFASAVTGNVGYHCMKRN